MTDVPGGVLHLVVCAAPPARDVGTLVELLREQGWTVYVIATPAAADWIDPNGLQRLTGHPVRSAARRPDDTVKLPEAAAVVVAPATFNTINKWVAGISDNAALGILNEALGLRRPCVVSPYVKASLAAHPAFGRSVAHLRELGVYLTDTEALRPDEPAAPLRWHVVADLVRQHVPSSR